MINFSENYKPIRVWLWIVYKITESNCGSQLFKVFIQTQTRYPKSFDKRSILIWKLSVILCQKNLLSTKLFDNVLLAKYLIYVTATLICYNLQSEYRSSHSQKKFSIKFIKTHRKTPALESLFNMVWGRNSCNFIKKRLQHSYFPVIFAKFLRIPFLQNTSGWLLLLMRLLKYLTEGKCKAKSPCLAFLSKPILKPTFSYIVFPKKYSSEPELPIFDSTVKRQFFGWGSFFDNRYFHIKPIILENLILLI